MDYDRLDAWTRCALGAAADAVACSAPIPALASATHAAPRVRRWGGGFAHARVDGADATWVKLAVEFANAADAVRNAKAKDADASLLRFRKRRKFVRQLLTACACAKGLSVARGEVSKRGGFFKIFNEARAAVTAIAQRRLVTPAVSLRDDLLLNKKGADGLAGDPAAAVAAEKALEHMLRDWFRHLARHEDLGLRLESVLWRACGTQSVRVPWGLCLRACSLEKSHTRSSPV